jgi:hypothetical protein
LLRVFAQQLFNPFLLVIELTRRFAGCHCFRFCNNRQKNLVTITSVSRICMSLNGAQPGNEHEK